MSRSGSGPPLGARSHHTDQASTAAIDATASPSVMKKGAGEGSPPASPAPSAWKAAPPKIINGGTGSTVQSSCVPAAAADVVQSPDRGRHCRKEQEQPGERGRPGDIRHIYPNPKEGRLGGREHQRPTTRTQRVRPARSRRNVRRRASSTASRGVVTAPAARRIFPTSCRCSSRFRMTPQPCWPGGRLPARSPPASSWKCGREPHSPQAVVFSTSIIDVTVGS